MTNYDNDADWYHPQVIQEYLEDVEYIAMNGDLDIFIENLACNFSDHPYYKAHADEYQIKRDNVFRALHDFTVLVRKQREEAVK